MYELGKSTLDKYIKEYFTFDKPVPFLTQRAARSLKARVDKLTEGYASMDKDKVRAEIEDIRKIEAEVFLHPVKLTDADRFLESSWVFQIRKERLAKSLPAEQQVAIIKMTNLGVLYFIWHGSSKANQQNFISTMATALSICFQEDIKEIKFETGSDGRHYLIVNKFLRLSDDDWDLMRKIICYQNIPDFTDKYVNPDIQEELDKINEVKSRQYQAPTLEERIAALCILSGMSYECVQGMTYRRFWTIERMSQNIESYNAKLNALYHGAKIPTSELQHYLFKKKKALGEFTPLEEFKKKIH